MENSVFFSTEGLTNTSANHVANLAKEYIQNLESTLDSLSFVNSYVSLIGSSEKTVIHHGMSSEEFNKIPNYIESIYQAKSLIAWLREAIKAREKMMNDIEAITVGQYAQVHGLEMPVKPCTPSYSMTAEDYIALLNVKDRNKIFELQTRAAVIGKLIHPNGDFAKARKEFMDKTRDSNKVSGDGRDTLIYSYEGTISPEDIEDMFFELQKRYREVQAELNGWNHKAEIAVENNNNALSETYNRGLAAYNREMEEFEAGLWSEKQKKRAEVQALRIVIPNSLKDIYEQIKSLGK